MQIEVCILFMTGLMHLFVKTFECLNVEVVIG